MNAETNFFRAILDDPHDNTVRLVYADWLEEQGQVARAELIRVQCALSIDWDDKARTTWLEQRSAELLREHGAEWTHGLPGEVQWRRGFPEIIRCKAVDYHNAPVALERLAPIQTVRLYQDNDPLEVACFRALTRCPLLARWTDLEIASSFLGLSDKETCFEMLVASPYLTRLRRLSVRENYRLGAAIQTLANANMSNLTYLDIYYSYDGGFGSSCSEYLPKIVESPYIANLEYFNFGKCDGKDDTLCALAASPYMSRLRTLKAAYNYFGANGVLALGISDRLPNLKHLDLTYSLSNNNAAQSLVDSPLISRLESLKIGFWELDDTILIRLAARTDVTQLRHLGIGGKNVTAQGLQRLLNSPAGAKISHLDCTIVDLSEEQITILINTPQLTHLSLFQGEWEAYDFETARRLQERFTILLEPYRG